jgi:hypothetical protein
MVIRFYAVDFAHRVDVAAEEAGAGNGCRLIPAGRSIPASGTRHPARRWTAGG